MVRRIFRKETSILILGPTARNRCDWEQSTQTKSEELETISVSLTFVHIVLRSSEICEVCWWFALDVVEGSKSASEIMRWVGCWLNLNEFERACLCPSSSAKLDLKYPPPSIVIRLNEKWKVCLAQWSISFGPSFFCKRFSFLLGVGERWWLQINLFLVQLCVHVVDVRQHANTSCRYGSIPPEVRSSLADGRHDRMADTISSLTVVRCARSKEGLFVINLFV